MAVAHVSTAITGAAGEYFAAAELSARGWIATISVPAPDVWLAACAIRAGG